jgi:hypothetical protein
MTNESMDRPSAWPNAADWPAEAPSPGFAERTVSAYLVSQEQRGARLPRKRWVRLVLLAAFVSASAWGAYQITYDVVGEPVAAQENEEPRVVASSLAFAPPATHAVAERAKVAPEIPRPVPIASKPGAPAAVAPPAPPRVPAPRCQCAPGFVVCGCSE